jgi:hypothetical protein
MPFAEPRPYVFDELARIARLHRARDDFLDATLQFLSPYSFSLRICFLLLKTEQQLVRKPRPFVGGELQRVGEHFVRSCHEAILLPAGAERPPDRP